MDHSQTINTPYTLLIIQNLQDGAPKIAKLPCKWLNYGLW